MLAVELLLGLLLAYAAVCSLYLATLCAAALCYRPPAPPDAAVPKPFWAVVVPAHNEASGIADTVHSLRAMDWPPDRLSVHVIADNCDDDTGAVAAAAGAVIHVRRAPDDRGKGQALDWFFRQCRDAYTTADLVAIVDADTLVEAGFTQAMTAAFAAPATLAAQGFYGVRNPLESWRTSLAAAALALFHHVRPAGRDVLGGTVGLRGNGMAFRAGLLARLGWPAHGLVEDAEFTLDLLRDDIRVRYVAGAVVLAEMAATRRQADTQRRRWEGGRLALLRSHLPQLLHGIAPRNALPRLDAALDLLTPPLTVLILAQCLAAAIAVLWRPWGWAAFMCLPLVSIGAVPLALWLRREPRIIWLRLLAAPAFVAWKLALYAKMPFGRAASAWTRTLRRGERP